MEKWKVIASSTVKDYSVAIICTDARYASFARDLEKIFKAITKNNGDYQKDFVKSDIAIIIVAFENESNYSNFQKNFEDLAR